MNPSAQIEARIALDVLANRESKRRNGKQARRYVLRAALCAFAQARRDLRFDAQFCYLPAYVRICDGWELWVQPLEYRKADPPIIARRVQLDWGGTTRDLNGLQRGPDFAMHALGAMLDADAELEALLQIIESTTELAQEQHAKNQASRRTRL